MSSGLQNVKSAIDNIKDDIKKEEVEDDSVQFERQIDEIKNLLMDEDVFVQDIKIKEEESHRKIVTCYMLKCTEEDIKNCPVKKIKRTIEKILMSHLHYKMLIAHFVAKKIIVIAHLFQRTNT